MPEIHKGNGQQKKLRQCERYDSPSHTQRMPFLGIKGRKDHDNDDNREEPTGIHQSLSLIPITMDDVAVEEEGEILHQLYDTRLP